MKKQFSFTILFLMLALLTACHNAAPIAEPAAPELPVVEVFTPESPYGQTFYFKEALCLNSQISVSSYDGFIPLAFQFLEDGRFLIDGKETSQPEDLQLTQKNFDELFYLVNREDAAAWRTANVRAWSVWYRDRENFVLMQQRDGTYLIARSYGQSLNPHFSHVFLTSDVPSESNGKILWYGPEKAAEIPTSTDLQDDSVYISTECLTNTSTTVFRDADTLRYYTIEDGAFVHTIRWWREERGRRDLGDRNWQSLPWTQEEWQGKPYYEALTQRFDISMKDWRYLKLASNEYLLSSGDVLILWDGDNAYRLEQMDGIGPARWAYMDKTDWQHLPVELSFTGEYDELWLTCEGGSMGGAFVYKNEDRFDYNLSTSDNKNIIYWTPMNDDGSRASEGVIQFTLLKGDAMFIGDLDEDDIFLTGTITLKLRGTDYKTVRIDVDRELPEDVSIEVLDYEGKTLTQK